MNDKSPSNRILACWGHICLVFAIVADSYRRNSEGVWPILLSFAGLIALVFGGAIFVGRPRLFFFLSEGGVEGRLSLNGVSRIVAWVVMIIIPVIWLISIIELQSRDSFGLGGRLVESYIFFAWMAVMGILSPVFFARD